MMTHVAYSKGALILIALFFFLYTSGSHAEIVSISAIVSTPPDTVVEFNGIAYPNAPITVLQDGLPFATATANAAARFSSATGSITPGNHTYTLTAKDALGRTSKVYQVALLIVAETTTTVNNIFFGPTIVLSSSSIAQGSPVTVSGITSPSSIVTIQFIAGSTATYTTTANSSGVWSRAFSSELSENSYTVRARSTDPDTSVSEWSTALTLTVGAPPDPCLGKNIADINCDGEVDTFDLSILLSFWNQTNPSNVRTDINADTKVDLVDFSIMMYHWTGPT